MRVIKKNAIQCLKCGDVIESKSKHDFKYCSCGSCFVDGGHSYVRIGGNQDDIEILTEYEEVPGCHVTVYLHYGGTTGFDVPLDQLKLIAENYEGMWHYIEAVDEFGNIVYRSPGIEKFIGQKGEDIADQYS